MVRIADEIVDSFPDLNRELELARFKDDVDAATENSFSSNPILQAFQDTYHKFGIDSDLVAAFFQSMEMDLSVKVFTPDQFTRYVYGSAEVVGLICLQVFLGGDKLRFNELSEPARRLGAGYQKLNFLRDLQSDQEERGRTYFPGMKKADLSDDLKSELEAQIRADFAAAQGAIPKLPKAVRAGVALSLRYYEELLRRIESIPAKQLLKTRVRVPNWRKATILARATFGGVPSSKAIALESAGESYEKPS